MNSSSLLILHSLKFLMLKVVWIFIIMFYSKRGQVSDSLTSPGRFGLIWHLTGSTMT